MKEKVWTALIVMLMVLFWAFVLASPVICNKEPRSHYSLFVCDKAGLCLPGR